MGRTRGSGSWRIAEAAAFRPAGGLSSRVATAGCAGHRSPAAGDAPVPILVAGGANLSKVIMTVYIAPRGETSPQRAMSITMVRQRWRLRWVMGCTARQGASGDDHR